MRLQIFRYILLGFILVVFGAVAPFLMVLHIIQASFWLCILAYSATMIGLFMGIIGAFEIHQDETN